MVQLSRLNVCILNTELQTVRFACFDQQITWPRAMWLSLIVNWYLRYPTYKHPSSVYYHIRSCYHGDPLLIHLVDLLLIVTVLVLGSKVLNMNNEFASIYIFVVETMPSPVLHCWYAVSQGRSA